MPGSQHSFGLYSWVIPVLTLTIRTMSACWNNLALSRRVPRTRVTLEGVAH